MSALAVVMDALGMDSAERRRIQILLEDSAVERVVETARKIQKLEDENFALRQKIGEVEDFAIAIASRVGDIVEHLKLPPRPDAGDS